jgi:hypothetical protein
MDHPRAPPATGIELDRFDRRNHSSAFLLKTQLADGSWFVKSRSETFQPYFESGFPHGNDHWISAAGTSWAVTAFALTQPVTLKRAVR